MGRYRGRRHVIAHAKINVTGPECTETWPSITLNPICPQ